MSGPIFDVVDITPFPIGGGKPIKFRSQTADLTDTPRIPQDLTKFIAQGTITQALLNDPNTKLRNDIVGQNIKKTIVFTVDTTSNNAGGGTDNIAFLQGTPDPTVANPAVQTGPNAVAAAMKATFWIETVQDTLTIPVWKPGQAPLRIKGSVPHPGAKVPYWKITPPHEITTPTSIDVFFTQIQYSQVVNLNFAKLTWPHVSVATLVPSVDLTVPASAWK
jgi:hypothetical protein